MLDIPKIKHGNFLSNESSRFLRYSPRTRHSIAGVFILNISTGLIGFEPTADPLTADCTTVVLQTKKGV